MNLGGLKPSAANNPNTPSKRIGRCVNTNKTQNAGATQK